MTELEKFKRRLIRMVARLQVEEKKPEDELWEYLRKQTKSDCKWLWERMRVLTLKRLKRLLMAEDRTENIAAIARMSLTDWLLYDSILVHEKIDVIGTDLKVEGRKWEPRPMYDLFSLVQQFDLEGLSDEPLARAWTAATVHYNSRGRQCSPMLLQRRWYQLKEATRQKFYNFWFMYRGNTRLLEDALKEKPTRLQAAIAKRYPHIITMPFRSWEKLIEDRFVIMPPEFEYQMKAQSGNLPSPIEDNAPDLVLLEPEIETIDLRVDSDSDNDLRDEVEGSKAQQMMADEDASAVKSITLKQEPMDEDADIIESIDLDQNNLDIDLEGIEAFENMDIPIEHNAAKKVSVDNTDAMESNEETRTSTETDIREDIEDPVTPKEAASDIGLEPRSSSDLEIVDETPADTGQKSKALDDTDKLHTENTEPDIEEVLPSENQAQEMAPAVISEVETHDPEVNMEMSTMPQIKNVVGSVNNFNDNAQSEKKSEEEYFDEECEIDIIKTELVDVSYEPGNDESNETDVVQAIKINIDIDESKTGNAEVKTTSNSLSEFNPDVTFEDDGIEFMDDGIIEENYTKSINAENVIVKEEITKDDHKEEAESQSIDLKLLMVPVVYTKKLEDMEVIKDEPVSHVNDKEKIELILNESKPVSKKSIQIKVEQSNTSIVSEDDEVAHDDLFDQPAAENNDHDSSSDETDDDDGIPEEKKVNRSSILFQKPRNRDYGPLAICKNPDFNTRLKRLTVGFLSYTRNRFLLRACKPLTIDLCKAFETRLVDNTIYFKEDSTSNYNNSFSQVVVKKEISDTNAIVEEEAPVVSKEDSVQKENFVQPIAPTSISAQGVMETMVKQQLLSPPSKGSTENVVKPDNDVDFVTERNKVIVLPNIDHVRRINRNLLVAEVSPMRVESANYLNEPPISLLPQSTGKLNPSLGETQKFNPSSSLSESENTARKESNNTVICRGEVIGGVTNNYVDFTTAKPKSLPWRPQDRVRVGFWTSSQSKKHKAITYSDEQLLTVDTLNKMLNIVQLQDPIKALDNEKMILMNRKQEMKLAEELQRRVVEVQLKSKGQRIEDHPPTLISKSTARKRHRKKAKAIVDQLLNESRYGTYCCWVKFKEVHRKSSNPHPCAMLECKCCCRKQSDPETDPSIDKVRQSIESVVEQSREIVRSERIQPDDKGENNDSVNNTNNDSNTIETNILEEDAVPDYSNETVVDTTKTTKTREKSIDDCVLVESDDTDTQNDNPHIPQLIIKRKRGRPSKTFNEKQFTVITRPPIDMAEDAEIENVCDTASETVSNQDPKASSTDACVVIDSDNSETQKRKSVKINIQFQSAINAGESKRKRGRHGKNSFGPRSQIEERSERVERRPLQIAPKPVSPNLQADNTQNVRLTRSRYNLLPVSKSKDKDKDRVIMFANKPSNNPIFLGHNKILLTDVPLPRNKNKPIQEAPPSIMGNTVLPRGVNVVLLPNGLLTCTVDPNVQLSPEELNSLGKIIEDVQKQLGSMANTSVQHVQNLPAGPTLQLVPGAVPTVVQGTSEVINLDEDEKKGEENSNNNEAMQQTPDAVQQNADAIQQNAEVLTSIPAVSNTVAASVLSTAENTVNVSDSVDEALSVSATKLANSADHPCSEPNAITDTVQHMDTGNNTQEIDPDAMKEPAPLEKKNVKIDETSGQGQDNVPNTSNEISKADDISEHAQTTEQDTLNKNTPEELSEHKRIEEPAKSNKKTILSDLMEMSGIFDEDIAPVAEPTPEQVAPAFPVVPEAITNILPQIPQVLDVNQPPPQAIADDLRELTPVTSFNELKYACMHNGNFFKLDLTTNALNPINVCIKKKTPLQAPTQYVDLTDDLDDAVNEKETSEITNEESLPAFVVRKTVTALPDSSKTLLKKGATAKPIKLFKVVHPFANSNILKRKVDDEPVKLDSTPIVSEAEEKSKAEKRPRKQQFDNLTYEMQYVNFIGSEGEQENYEFEGSFEENAAAADDSDSSDDEPLAKKVKRRDEMQKVGQERTDEIVETATTAEGHEPEINIPLTEVPENDANVSDLPEQEQMDVEGEIGPTELEFLSDNNEDDDENCILGV